MDDQNIIQERLKETRRIGQVGNEHLGELLHRQHYDFAHKVVPYVIKEYFEELVNQLVNGSVQEWINQLWTNNVDDTLINYSVAVHPVCQYAKASEEIGLIYFIMPAPRTTGEALYTAIVFLMDEDSPSTWLWRYFTLELGVYLVPSYLLTASADDGDLTRWTFAEWNESNHINRGKFKLEPTLDNFLAVVLNEAESDWYQG